MYKTRSLLAFSALILAALACNTLLPPAGPAEDATPLAGPTSTMVVITEPTFPATTSSLPESEAAVPRVGLEEAFAAWASGAAVFVDVRNQQVYDISHIPGATLIPLGEFENNISDISLAKDAWIITYCT